MKKQKSNPTKPYKITIIILAIIIVGLLSGLIFTITQTKSSTEREYLALYEHLMTRYPEFKCKENTPTENYTCIMTDYGISRDGDPYVSYMQYTSDATTHKQKDEGTSITLYFQHPNQPGDSYGEALGYN